MSQVREISNLDALKLLRPTEGKVLIPDIAYSWAYKEPSVVTISWPHGGGVQVVIPVKQFYWMKDNGYITKTNTDRDTEFWQLSHAGLEYIEQNDEK